MSQEVEKLPQEQLPVNRLLREPGGLAYLLLAAAWVLMWLAPWESWLASLPWMRVGIGLLIFAAPGMALSMSLVGERLTLPAHFTSGLALSVFFVGGLGLLGRIVHFPFDYIKPVFALAGLAGLFAVWICARSGRRLYKPKRFPAVTIILFLLLVAVGILANLASRFGGDDLSYLAYLTTWQHSPALTFQEVVFDTGGPDAIRFWLAMFPMDLAFLAQISHIPGLLLLGLYLEPFLVTIGLLAAYNLYEDFLESEGRAMAALLLQFAFFCLLQGVQQVGTTFFVRLSEDKAFAAFILTPVFFLSLRVFLESFTFRSGAFFLLSGLSLSLVHPVILAYSLFIGGVYAALILIPRKDYKKLGVVALLMAVTLLPDAPLRFIQISSSPKSFDLESAVEGHVSILETRIMQIEGTPFYGFHPERIQILAGSESLDTPAEIFFSWSYLWVLLAGFIWSLFHLKRATAAPFMTATALLVLACGIPYTGWMVGYFVSARMLWRSPWFLPLGLFGTILLEELLKLIWHNPSGKISSRITRDNVTFSLVTLLSIALISSIFVSGLPTERKRLMGVPQYYQRLESLTFLGDYLERNISEPSRFVANVQLMNYLPGLSSKSKVVFFRTERYSSGYYSWDISVEEAKLLLSSEPLVSIGKRVKILKKLGIRYILVEKPAVKNYYAGYPKLFRMQQFGQIWIVEYLKYAQ